LFDLIRYDNHLLYNQPLYKRKKELQLHFPSYPSLGIQILEGQSIETTNLFKLLQESVCGGCEGLVLKNQQSVYGCGLRNSKQFD